MSTTTTLTGSLVASKTITLSKAFTSEFLIVREFELAAGDLATITVDSTLEGTDLQMLYLEAKNNSDTTQHTMCSYGVSDSDAATPASGTSWRAFNGLVLSYEQLTLSATYKFYIYNSGANRANITAVLGMDGA